jgi:uncharacterized membrane protein YdbT with pleckstrin-like domain
MKNRRCVVEWTRRSEKTSVRAGENKRLSFDGKGKTIVIQLGKIVDAWSSGRVEAKIPFAALSQQFSTVPTFGVLIFGVWLLFVIC